jgi:hypothetical protein
VNLGLSSEIQLGCEREEEFRTVFVGRRKEVIGKEKNLHGEYSNNLHINNLLLKVAAPGLENRD